MVVQFLLALWMAWLVLVLVRVYRLVVVYRRSVGNPPGQAGGAAGQSGRGGGRVFAPVGRPVPEPVAAVGTGSNSG